MGYGWSSNVGKALSAAVQDVFFVGEGLFTTVGGRDDW